MDCYRAQTLQYAWRRADFKPRPANFTVTLFKELINKPFCELFPPSTAQGIVGHCHVHMPTSRNETCPGVLRRNFKSRPLSESLFE